MILRIEDTDVDRHREGSEVGILNDLLWMGLEWDEGPDRGGRHAPYRQSERGPLYRAAAERLLQAGRAYPCFCRESTANREAARGAVIERCPCASLPPSGAAGEHALRFRSFEVGHDGGPVRFRDRLRGDVEVPADGIGDPVILRQDGRPTYNFAVVVDDAAMDIDLVVRGDDHLSNTPRQVLLFTALGHTPPEFAHLPMVRGADGSRLSKRHGAVSVAEYRGRGYPVAGLLNALALLGWAPPEDRTIVDLAEMVEYFDLDRVNRSPAAFDSDKLDWICNQHIQRMPPAALAGPVAAALAAVGRLPADAAGDPALRVWLEGLAELIQSGLQHFDQVPERASALFHEGGAPLDEASIQALRGAAGVRVVAELVRLVAERPGLDLEGWRALKQELQANAGVKGKDLFHPLRAALTGALAGPELDRLIPLVSQGHTLMPDRIPSIAERATRTAEWLS